MPFRSNTEITTLCRNVKKIYKEVTKLFSKKFSIDVSDGGKVKKHNKGEVIFEQVKFF